MESFPQHADRPLVLVTEPLAPEPLGWLGARAEVVRCPPEDPGFDDAISRAHALVVRTATRVDAGLLDRAPRLRVVGRAGVGLENIDQDACARRGVAVVHTPGANADAVAEYTIAMMLGALRPIATERDAPDRADTPSAWDAWRRDATTERSAQGETLGIIGLGTIGARVARIARALSMRVLYHDIREIDPAERAGAEPATLEAIVARCGVVSIHVDGRPENTALIGPGAFASMRADVILINTARGAVLDEDAAARFARAHPDARLILDVHAREPFDRASPLASLPNVTRTPHIAAGTRRAKTAMSWVVRDVWDTLTQTKTE